jgi:hypothetical protein
MTMGRLLLTGLAACGLVLAGCQGEADMSKGDQNTLKENLNKPVDVEKIRAEYAKEKGPQTGAATDQGGM